MRLAALAMVLAAAPGLAWAGDCDAACIGDTPSVLGIDYHARLPVSLAAILAAGEAEYLATRRAAGNPLTAQTRTATRQHWREAINLMFAGTLAPGFTGAPGEPSFDLFRDTAPVMLARLKRCGPDADRRLHYLHDLPLAVGGPAE